MIAIQNLLHNSEHYVKAVGIYINMNILLQQNQHSKDNMTKQLKLMIPESIDSK